MLDLKAGSRLGWHGRNRLGSSTGGWGGGGYLVSRTPLLHLTPMLKCISSKDSVHISLMVCIRGYFCFNVRQV